MSMRAFKKVVMLFGLAFVIAGCQSVGTIDGVSDGKPVQIDYEQGFLHNDGELKITMHDGELFAGKFVQISSSSSGSAWEIGQSLKDDAWIFNGSSTTSSLAEALLIGDKGNTMTCQFQFSTPDFGINGGGIGKCEISDERSVYATF